ncbi:14432_t:CDS:2, partial [Gigaspora margarita]
KSLESQNGSTVALKENNHVKVKGFYSTDEEDPLTNNWSENHQLKIVSGYLKGMATNWNKENKDDIESWKAKNENKEERNKSFYHLFVEHFTLPEWQYHRVNLDRGLLDGFIVEMFLSGLKKNHATFVAVAAPKDLNEAIAVAKRVEADNYYRQNLTEPHEPQPKLEKELGDFKERIEVVALNYTTLMDIIKTIEGQSQKNYYQDSRRKIEYHNCERVGHRAQNCMSRKY